MCACSVVPDSATPWTAARQAPLSVGFSRQDYWSGLPFPSQGDLPDPEIESGLLVSPALAGGFFITAPPRKPNFSPWTAANQAPLSLGFSRQEYWSGQPFPSPGVFPTQGSNPALLCGRQILYHLSYQFLWLLNFVSQLERPPIRLRLKFTQSFFIIFLWFEFQV